MKNLLLAVCGLVLMTGCVDDGMGCSDWAKRDVCVEEGLVELNCLSGAVISYNGTVDWDYDEVEVVQTQYVNYELCVKFSFRRPEENYSAYVGICTDEALCKHLLEESSWFLVHTGNQSEYHRYVSACFAPDNCTIEELLDANRPVLRFSKSLPAGRIIPEYEPLEVKRCVDWEEHLVCVDNVGI